MGAAHRVSSLHEESLAQKRLGPQQSALPTPSVAASPRHISAPSPVPYAFVCRAKRPLLLISYSKSLYFANNSQRQPPRTSLTTPKSINVIYATGDDAACSSAKTRTFGMASTPGSKLRHFCP